MELLSYTIIKTNTAPGAARSFCPCPLAAHKDERLGPAGRSRSRGLCLAQPAALSHRARAVAPAQGPAAPGLVAGPGEPPVQPARLRGSSLLLTLRLPQSSPSPNTAGRERAAAALRLGLLAGHRPLVLVGCSYGPQYCCGFVVPPLPSHHPKQRGHDCHFLPLSPTRETCGGTPQGRAGGEGGGPSPGGHMGSTQPAAGSRGSGFGTASHKPPFVQEIPQGHRGDGVSPPTLVLTGTDPHTRTRTPAQVVLIQFNLVQPNRAPQSCSAPKKLFPHVPSCDRLVGRGQQWDTIAI